MLALALALALVSVSVSVRRQKIKETMHTCHITRCGAVSGRALRVGFNAASCGCECESGCERRLEREY